MYFTLSNVFAVTFILLCYVWFFYIIMTGSGRVLQFKQAFCFKLKGILLSNTVLSNTNIHNIEILTTKRRHLFSTCSEYSLPYIATLKQTKPKSSRYYSDWLHSKQNRIQDREIICATCLEHGRTVRRQRRKDWLS